MEYKSGYDLWHQKQDTEPHLLGIWYRWVNSILQKEDLDNKLVLEIGCGRGVFVDYLCDTPNPPKKYHGCDYSADAVRMAGEKYQGYENAIFHREDIQSLSFESNYFDTAISCETIEHIPNPAQGLSELYRVLKPGGKLILTCPNYFNFFGIWCLYRKIIGKPYTEGGQPYVNYILMPTIFYNLKKLGFRIEHVHSSELIIPARVPKTYYPVNVPAWFTFFGYRTYYILRK